MTLKELVDTINSGQVIVIVDKENTEATALQLGAAIEWFGWSDMVIEFMHFSTKNGKLYVYLV